jgi:hypothetical protein
MWVRYNPEGHMSNTLGTFPGREYWGAEAHGTILPMAFLLGRSTTVIAHGLHLYVADSDTYEIRIYYVDGALKSIVRRRHEPLGVTRADVDAVIAGSQPEREQVLRQQSAPATMPAFGWNDSRLAAAIHVDDSDNLWVKEYDRPTERRYRWSVFDSGGQWLGIVDFAGAVEPKHIGD